MVKILYFVWNKVPNELEKEWINYIDYEHIPDVLKTKYFIRAQRLKIIDGDAPGNYLIIYESKSRGDFESYIEKETSRLRKDFMDHFGSKIVTTRIILEESFSQNLEKR